MNRFLHLLGVLVVSILSSSAQSNCAENLEIASKYIDQGKVIEAVNLIRPCSKEIGSPSAAQAYRILTIVAILQNQNDSALYFARKMLELDPLYKTNLLNDPRDFTALLKKINVIPKFSIGLAFMYGLNITNPQITGTYQPVVNEYTKKYRSNGGYQFGLVTGYNLDEHIGLELNLIGNSKKYKMEYASGSSFKISETLNSFDFPILFRYTFFPFNRLRLNLVAGPYGSVLINSYNDMIIKDSTMEKEVQRYSSKTRRNIFNYGLAGGFGGIYKLGQGHLSLDIRYFKSLSNITKTAGRYDNATLIYEYAYLDDDIKLDNLAFYFGYHYYLNYKIIE